MGLEANHQPMVARRTSAEKLPTALPFVPPCLVFLTRRHPKSCARRSTSMPSVGAAESMFWECWAREVEGKSTTLRSARCGPRTSSVTPAHVVVTFACLRRTARLAIRVTPRTFSLVQTAHTSSHRLAIVISTKLLNDPSAHQTC